MRNPLIVFVVAAMLVAGCGSDDDTRTGTTGAVATTTAAAAADTSTAAAPAAALPDGLAGTWTRNVSAADIERNATNKGTGPGEEPITGGPTELKIDPDRVTVRGQDGFEIPEFAAFSADQKLEILAYVNTSVAVYCGPDKPQNASYTWALDGDQLTLATADDTCADRNAILVGSWKRAS